MWRAAVGRLFDARLLMWMTAVVVASGLPLLIGYEPGGTSTGLGLPWVRPAIRSVHAASSLFVVVGAVVHLAARVLNRTARRRAIRSGAAGLAALGMAAVSGAMIVPTADGEALRAAMGLEGSGRAAILAAAAFHIAYSSLLVMLTLYWHAGRFGRRRTFGSWRRGVLAAGIAAAAGVLVLGSLDGRGHPASWVLAPPVAGLWSWILVASVVLMLLAGPVAGSRPTTVEATSDGDAAP